MKTDFSHYMQTDASKMFSELLLNSDEEGALGVLDLHPQLLTSPHVKSWILDCVQINCSLVLKRLLPHVDGSVTTIALRAALEHQYIPCIHLLAPKLDQSKVGIMINAAQTGTAVRALLPHIQDPKSLHGNLTTEIEKKRFGILRILAKHMGPHLPSETMIFALRRNNQKAMEVLYPLYSHDHLQKIAMSIKSIGLKHFHGLETLTLFNAKVLHDELHRQIPNTGQHRAKKM